jgi:deoxyribonuclease V
MKLAMAVHDHGEHGACAAAVAFDDWDAREPTRTHVTRTGPLEKPAPGQRGQADLRHLPVLLQLLRDHALQPDTIVLDDAVHTDAADTPGLGRHLYDALGGKTAVIGISTKSMPGLTAQYEVHREEEARPVFVTCAGVDIGAAKVRVRAMSGRKRVPALVKMAVRLAKGGEG